MTAVLVAIIQVCGTVAVALFTYFTNHKVERITNVKEELKKDYELQHKEIIDKINDLEETVDKNDIDTVRSRIVSFDNICRLDKTHDQIKRYQYDTIFKDINKWAQYHKKYPDLNGEIDIAIQNIQESFKVAKF